MKSAYGMIGYLASAAAVVALSITTVSFALAPTEAVVADAKAEAAKEAAAAVTSAPEARIVDGERVPVWIAPTTKYPASALALNNAPRAKQIAREDWRLNARSDRYEEPTGMSSYAADPRMQRDTFGYYRGAPSFYREAPVYRETRNHEPIQFRERSEPR